MIASYRRLVLVGLILLAACTPAAQEIVVVPTLAVLPSVTPSPTAPPTLTFTPAPTLTPTHTFTPTPNAIETQLADLNATNAAAQMTLDVLLTRSAPTAALDATSTPSPTITATLNATLPPISTPIPVVEMQPILIYLRSTANLRTCAHRDCDPVAQLPAGDALLATGTIQGEAITAGRAIWYRVEYQGQELYVYGELITVGAPTSAPVIVQPPMISRPTAASLPPNPGSAGCPSMSATCSQLTCEQAYACLAAGHSSLDRDHDGIPCESVCSS